MQSPNSSQKLKPGLKPLPGSLPHSGRKLPPLENLSLSMPIDTNTLNEKSETPHLENGTSTSNELEIEKAPRSPKFKKLEKQYKEAIDHIAVLLFPFSPLDAKSLLESKDELADTNVSYAEVNKDFCQALETVLNASPLISMIGAYAGVVSAILSNHGINPLENMMKKRLEQMNGKASLSGLS